MSESSVLKPKLLLRLVDVQGTFTFFREGDERILAHHRSNRQPHCIYKGAALSPYFCNLRTANNAGDKQGTLDAETMEQIGVQLLELALDDISELRYFTGIPNAGYPIARAVAAAAGKKGMHVGHVVFDKLEGEDGRLFACSTNSSHVVQAVFDDVITVADVKARFFKTMDHKPPLYVLIDRQEGGAQILEAMGYTVRAVFGIDDVLEACLGNGRIDLAMAERVQKYSAGRRKLIAEHMDEIVTDLTRDSL